MLETEVRLPVLFQGVDTDLAVPADVGMEDLGREEGFGRRHGKVFGQGTPDGERPAKVRSPGCAITFSMKNIVLEETFGDEDHACHMFTESRIRIR